MFSVIWVEYGVDLYTFYALNFSHTAVVSMEIGLDLDAMLNFCFSVTNA